MLIDPKLSHYLREGKTEGIIRIYNLQSDETLLVKSTDLIKDIAKIRFQLDLGIYSNKELQKSYQEIGLELFSLEPMAIKEKDITLNQLYENCLTQLKDKKVKFF